jgi:preprotein translocase subunit SecG
MDLCYDERCAIQYIKDAAMSWINIALLILQAISGVFIVLLVLLHSPKSDGAGIMGGMTTSFATQRGTETTLNTLTKYSAIVFFVVSFILGYYF